ncbi:MAG: rRNA adenine N-6-methyltransferase family protein, partial [bacterium]|nr:rRNA adenine N-6-methyltransferase family protein [bacterium]
LLMTSPAKPQSIVLLVQKEVAERIVAGPGQMSVLALSVQLFGRPAISGFVSKDSFYPSPKVDSAILKITVHASPVVNLPQKKLFQIIKIGFAAKRKTLANNLAAGFNVSKSAAQLALQASAIPIAARAQELSIEDWQKLNIALEPLLNTAQTSGA